MTIRRIAVISLSIALLASAVWAAPEGHFILTPHIEHVHADGTVSTWCVVEPLVFPFIREYDEAGNIIPPPKHGYIRHGWTWYPDGTKKWFTGREKYVKTRHPDGTNTEPTESVDAACARQGYLAR